MDAGEGTAFQWQCESAHNRVATARRRGISPARWRRQPPSSPVPLAMRFHAARAVSLHSFRGQGPGPRPALSTLSGAGRSMPRGPDPPPLRWAFSSGGKSARLITVRSVVRVHKGPPPAATHSGGCSSAGRAPALQAGGRRFEPAHLHHRHHTPVPVRLGRFAPDPVLSQHQYVCVKRSRGTPGRTAEPSRRRRPTREVRHFLPAPAPGVSARASVN